MAVACLLVVAACSNDLRVERGTGLINADASAPQFSAETKAADTKGTGAKGDAITTKADGTTGAPESGDALVGQDGSGGPPSDDTGAQNVTDALVDYSADAGAGADTTVCDAAEFCATDADCPLTPCSIGTCSGGCCINKPAPASTVCDDGNPCTKSDKCKLGVCTGILTTCADSLDCTTDACDPVVGKCQHALAANFCLIAGKCVADGQASQATPCKTCSVAQASDAWTVTPDCCGNDTECPAGTVCEKALCDPTTNKCGLQPILGCCTQDSACSDGNACTKDTCDVQTGTCAYVAISCTDPNPCQAAICDGATGECKVTTKAGWCLIDGGCHPEGEANPANDCQSCASAKSASMWTPAVGSLCSDGNACTFGDSCQPNGKCVGQAQQGCCLSDADCGPTGDPCAINVCDAKLGLCTPKAIAGCCATGMCCDAASNTIKAAKAICGGGPIAIEYQCSGQTIQKREISAGCNGSSPTGCVTTAQFQNVGGWQNVQTCGTGTQCTASGSSQMPTCKVTTPAGSCAGSCGTKSGTGSCYCDSVCTAAGDCCKDYMALCGCASGECCDVATKFPKAKGTACGAVKTQFQCSGKSVQKRTGLGQCDGKNVCTTATADIKWSTWSTTQTCTSSQNCVIATDGGSGSCVAAPAGSCVGHCGAKSTGSCWCDTACKSLGDCCADFDNVGCGDVQTCNAVPTKSCKGKCGGQGTGLCWCDELCESIGDCCPDKKVCACL